MAEKIPVKCPNCGAEVEKPKKMWPLIGRPARDGSRIKLMIGQFECPKCGKKFKVAVKKERIPPEGR